MFLTKYVNDNKVKIFLQKVKINHERKSLKNSFIELNFGNYKLRT